MKRAGYILALLLSASAGAAAAQDQPAPEKPAAKSQDVPKADIDLIGADKNVEHPELDGRHLPGSQQNFPPPVTQINPGAVTAPPPEAFPADQIPVPDRWRLIETLGVNGNWFDPYNQNALKGDRPIKGTKDWFFTLNAISDTVVEPRSFPLPVAVQTGGKGSLDTFGRDGSIDLSQTVLLGASVFEGATAFKPPEIEFRLTVGFNWNYAEADERRILSIDSSKAPHRSDDFVGVQEAFVDYHIRDVSDRYDFDSVRVGIQPFSDDFRGFLFQDNQLGIRLFGDRDDNRWQYNLAAFAFLEKDTNSGLNDLGQDLRHDYVMFANLYRQDFPTPGFTSQLTVAYNADREATDIHYDKNGFPVRPALIGDDRPRDFDVVYLGYNGDGHFGRVNLTASAYAALGQDRNSIFTSKPADIRSWFAAAEPSYDFDWIRVKLSGLYASGDSKPHDNVETGFDAIYEDPLFAGADTSYWIRQAVPFAGGGQNVFLAGRNGVLADLRSSKDEGQSNFNNPGTILLGTGADFDVLPQLRLSANLNHLWFVNTAVLQTLRQEGTIPNDIGWDYSLAATYRPLMTQNIVFRASAAVLDPGAGFGDLFTNSGHDSRYYSLLLNAIVTY